MTIQLQNIGKRYNYEWIFRGISLHLKAGKKYAVTGHNGSGKSTFLKILSGSLTPSKGEILYAANSSPIPADLIFQHISLAAPYIELIEEFTLQEIIDFHFKFKESVIGLTAKKLLDIAGLQKERDKFLKYFSSGMKQRIKIALAVFSDVPIILLDEPTTNLDERGAEWYRELLDEYSKNRLVVISSNLAREYSFCDEEIDISTYK